MSDTMTAFNSEAEYAGCQSKKKRGTAGRIFHELRSNKFMYALALPGILWFFVFAYLPMGGIVIAFQDFKAVEGIKGSEFIGLKNFEFFFSSNDWIENRHQYGVS